MKKITLKMKKKTLILSFLSIFIIIIGLLFVGKTDNRIIFTVKNSIPLDFRIFIKKSILFPFYQQSEINKLTKDNKSLSIKSLDLENHIGYLREYITKVDLNLNTNDSIILPQIENEKTILSNLKNEYKLKKFYFIPTTPWQYNGRKPGAYLFQHEKMIFTIDGNGKIGYFPIDELENSSLKFNKIKNNLNKLIKHDSLIHSKSKFGFRGLMINKGKIYISYQKKVLNDCYNISIMKAEFNLKSLNFKDFFTYDECSTNMANHSGGKMVPFDDQSFLFTTGDAQIFISAQKEDSMFGKLLKINYDDASFNSIAKGMRDTQGASLYKEDNLVIMTEHGPQGGDEINILKLDEFDKNINFGWPIATYGGLGPTPIVENKFDFKDGDNNHAVNGFKEPAHWYKSKSIAPSAIINVDNFRDNFKSDFFMSTMGNIPAPGRRSIHHIRFDKKYEKLTYLDIIPIGERIRDLIYLKDQKKIILILENSPSIAVLY